MTGRCTLDAHIMFVDVIDIFFLSHDCNNSNFVCVQYDLTNLYYSVCYFFYLT